MKSPCPLPASFLKAIEEEEKTRLKLQKKSDRHVLLIGGAGYIGSVLTGYLLRQGLGVQVFDNFIYRNQRAICSYYSHDNFTFAYGDMNDLQALERALATATDVVILAGLVGDPITKSYPEASQTNNVEGIQKVLAACDNKSLNKVIFVSTCSNYGLIPKGATADENFALQPLSSYAKAKVRMEAELLARKNHPAFCGTILRFATAFGLSPRMRFDLTINEFAREMYLHNPLVVYDADTWRPYCHVIDFSRAVFRVLQAPREKVFFEVFNAGGDENNYTKRMIVTAIENFIPDAPITYQENGPDPRNYRVDFSKIRRTLFFEPQFSVVDGILELLKALQNHVFDHVALDKNFYGNYEITQ